MNPMPVLFATTQWSLADVSFAGSYTNNLLFFGRVNRPILRGSNVVTTVANKEPTVSDKRAVFTTFRLTLFLLQGRLQSSAIWSCMCRVLEPDALRGIRTTIDPATPGDLLTQVDAENNRISGHIYICKDISASVSGGAGTQPEMDVIQVFIPISRVANINSELNRYRDSSGFGANQCLEIGSPVTVAEKPLHNTILRIEAAEMTICLLGGSDGECSPPWKRGEGVLGRGGGTPCAHARYVVLVTLAAGSGPSLPESVGLALYPSLDTESLQHSPDNPPEPRPNCKRACHWSAVACTGKTPVPSTSRRPLPVFGDPGFSTQADKLPFVRLSSPAKQLDRNISGALEVRDHCICACIVSSAVDVAAFRGAFDSAFARASLDTGAPHYAGHKCATPQPAPGRIAEAPSMAQCAICRAAGVPSPITAPPAPVTVSAGQLTGMLHNISTLRAIPSSATWLVKLAPQPGLHGRAPAQVAVTLDDRTLLLLRQINFVVPPAIVAPQSIDGNGNSVITTQRRVHAEGVRVPNCGGNARSFQLATQCLIRCASAVFPAAIVRASDAHGDEPGLTLADSIQKTHRCRDIRTMPTEAHGAAYAEYFAEAVVAVVPAWTVNSNRLPSTNTSPPRHVAHSALALLHRAIHQVRPLSPRSGNFTDMSAMVVPALHTVAIAATEDHIAPPCLGPSHRKHVGTYAAVAVVAAGGILCHLEIGFVHQLPGVVLLAVGTLHIRVGHSTMVGTASCARLWPVQRRAGIVDLATLKDMNRYEKPRLCPAVRLHGYENPSEALPGHNNSLRNSVAADRGSMSTVQLTSSMCHTLSRCREQLQLAPLSAPPAHAVVAPAALGYGTDAFHQSDLLIGSGEVATRVRDAVFVEQVERRANSTGHTPPTLLEVTHGCSPLGDLTGGLEATALTCAVVALLFALVVSALVRHPGVLCSLSFPGLAALVWLTPLLSWWWTTTWRKPESITEVRHTYFLPVSYGLH
jgi:hypothetical protein